MKKTVLLAIGLLWLLLPVAASGNKEAVADVEVPAVFAGENTDIGEGTITVLTNVTEGNRLAVMEEYARQFDDLYPGTQKIEFESIDDYENQVKIRLSSSNYGDVLLIPNTVEISKLGEYFESLGDYNTFIPVLVIFIALQKYIYNGLTQGSIK
jgi:ABC-type glycerol-3-phosphate transport system substrate-binding protein